MEKSAGAFRTIREVSLELDVPQHVLRFWEQKFPQIKPLKRGGGRRYYRPGDVELIRTIRRLLYAEGYTIRGVQRILKDQGVRAVVSGATLATTPETEPADWVDDVSGLLLPVEDDETRADDGESEPVRGVDRRQIAALLDELRGCAALLKSLCSRPDDANDEGGGHAHGHSVEAP